MVITPFPQDYGTDSDSGGLQLGSRFHVGSVSLTL